MEEKVYLMRKSYILSLGFLAVFLFAFLLFWSLLSWGSPHLQGLAYLFLVLAVVMPLFALLFSIETIVFDREGVTFKRKLGPITIQKITNLGVRTSKGKEMGLKIVGLAPDGERIRKIRIMRGGDVDKRWEEFKKDLQKIKSM